MQRYSLSLYSCLQHSPNFILLVRARYLHQILFEPRWIIALSMSYNGRDGTLPKQQDLKETKLTWKTHDVSIVSQMPSAACQPCWVLLCLSREHAAVQPEVHCCHVSAEVAVHQVQQLGIFWIQLADIIHHFFVLCRILQRSQMLKIRY